VGGRFPGRVVSAARAVGPVVVCRGRPYAAVVQEFRPAAVIAADTELAQRIESREPAAVRAFVERYGAAVIASAVPAVGRSSAVDVAFDVFVTAVEHPIRPGDDFAPWLARAVAERAGAVDEERWEVAMAVAAIDPAVRPQLREHHLHGPTDLDADLARHELRLQRRLSHVGEPDDAVAALARPDVWIDVDTEFVELVVDAVAAPAESTSDVGDERPAERSRVSRSLRPVLFGLGGAMTVLFVAIVGLSAASGTPEQPDFTVDLVPTGALLDVEGGEITVTERDAGIEIRLQAITLPRRAGGLYYEGRVVLDEGDEISAGTFAEGDGVTLWAGVGLEDAVAFRIVLGDIDSRTVDDVVLKADLSGS